MSNTIRPEIRAAVEAVMRTAWQPPAEATEEVLVRADAEARRFASEWSRLGEQVESEGEQETLQPLIDHAYRLVEFLTAAPVQSATTAALSLRHLLGTDGEDSIGLGIEASIPIEFHDTGFARLQEWLEVTAAKERAAASNRNCA